nr:N-acetylmuramoyl-L-alanine amidase [Chryseobacterium sp. P1-3]
MKGIKLLTLSVFSTVLLSSFVPVNKKYIVIDAGHGGNDHGVVFGQFSEKDISLDIAREIQKINRNQDAYEIILTRDGDSHPTLSERTDQINKLNPEMVISLHVNRSPQEETPNHGVEVFVQNSEDSKKLAGKIYKKIQRP